MLTFVQARFRQEVTKPYFFSVGVTERLEKKIVKRLARWPIKTLVRFQIPAFRRYRNRIDDFLRLFLIALPKYFRFARDGKRANANLTIGSIPTSMNRAGLYSKNENLLGTMIFLHNRFEFRSEWIDHFRHLIYLQT
jgi:hypothetical protein